MWQVLQALQDNGLVIHVEKYVWGVPELDYLDHQISMAAVLQLHSHVKAIHEFPRPSTVKELQSFWGWSTLSGGFYLDWYAPSAPSPVSYMAAGRGQSTWRGSHGRGICCCQAGLAGGHQPFPSCGRSDSQPGSGCFGHARGSMPATAAKWQASMAASRVLLCYSGISSFRHIPQTSGTY